MIAEVEGRSEYVRWFQMKHWRIAALEVLPTEESLINHADEEMGIYNFLFLLLESFNDAVLRRDVGQTQTLLTFPLTCLRNEFKSDGEDLAVAAGVSFIEHLCDQRSAEDWRFVLTALSRDDYALSRRWLKQWLDEETFRPFDLIARDR